MRRLFLHISVQVSEGGGALGGRLKRRADSTPYRSPQQSPQQLPFFTLRLLISRGPRVVFMQTDEGLVGDPGGWGALAGGLIEQDRPLPYLLFLLSLGANSYCSSKSHARLLQQAICCLSPSSAPTASASNLRSVLSQGSSRVGTKQNAPIAGTLGKLNQNKAHECTRKNGSIK